MTHKQIAKGIYHSGLWYSFRRSQHVNPTLRTTRGRLNIEINPNL